jgi:hypothetical protein
MTLMTLIYADFYLSVISVNHDNQCNQRSIGFYSSFGLNFTLLFLHTKTGANIFMPPFDKPPHY